MSNDERNMSWSEYGRIGDIPPTYIDKLEDEIAALRAAHEALLRRTQSMETALDHERADNAKLRAFAREVLDEYRAADMVDEVVFLDEEEMSDIMQKHALLDDLGNPTALLSGRGEGQP